MKFEDFIKDKHIEMKSLESLKLRDQYKFVLVEYVDVKGESKVRYNNFKSKIETELKTLQSLNHKGVLNFKQSIS